MVFPFRTFQRLYVSGQGIAFHLSMPARSAFAAARHFSVLIHADAEVIAQFHF